MCSITVGCFINAPNLLLTLTTYCRSPSWYLYWRRSGLPGKVCQRAQRHGHSKRERIIRVSKIQQCGARRLHSRNSHEEAQRSSACHPRVRIRGSSMLGDLRGVSPMSCFPAFAGEADVRRDWLGARAVKIITRIDFSVFAVLPGNTQPSRVESNASTCVILSFIGSSPSLMLVNNIHYVKQMNQWSAVAISSVAIDTQISARRRNYWRPVGSGDRVNAEPVFSTITSMSRQGAGRWFGRCRPALTSRTCAERVSARPELRSPPPNGSSPA
jgi:hypothetical protein